MILLVAWSACIGGLLCVSCELWACNTKTHLWCWRINVICAKRHGNDTKWVKMGRFPLIEHFIYRVHIEQNMSPTKQQHQKSLSFAPEYTGIASHDRLSNEKCEEAWRWKTVDLGGFYEPHNLTDDSYLYSKLCFCGIRLRLPILLFIIFTLFNYSFR